jgi:hypothetical protein
MSIICKIRGSRHFAQILELPAKLLQHATEHLSELTIDLKHRILLC